MQIEYTLAPKYLIGTLRPKAKSHTTWVHGPPARGDVKALNPLSTGLRQFDEIASCSSTFETPKALKPRQVETLQPTRNPEKLEKPTKVLKSSKGLEVSTHVLNLIP